MFIWNWLKSLFGRGDDESRPTTNPDPVTSGRQSAKLQDDGSTSTSRSPFNPVAADLTRYHEFLRQAFDRLKQPEGRYRHMVEEGRAGKHYVDICGREIRPGQVYYRLKLMFGAPNEKQFLTGIISRTTAENIKLAKGARRLTFTPNGVPIVHSRS